MNNLNFITKSNYKGIELSDDKYKKILNEMIISLKENKKDIIKNNDLDLEYGGTKINFEYLLEIIEDNKEKATVKTNYNTIAFTYFGDIYITLSLCLEAIRTKSRVILLIEDRDFLVSYFIVDLFKEILEDYGIKNIIYIFNCNNRDEIKKNAKYFSKLICIDNYFVYFSHYKSLKDCFYYGFNTVAVYCESDNMYDLLMKMEEFAIEKKVYLREIEANNVEDAINIINDEKVACNALILTESKENIEKFKSGVKCKEVYANENPFKDRRFVILEDFFKKTDSM